MSAILLFCLLLQAERAVAQSSQKRGLTTSTELQTLGTSSGLKFIPNRGQLSDQYGKPMPEVLYTLDGYGLKTYFTKGSMHYVFSKRSRTSLLSKERGRGEVGLNNDTLALYRVDVKFLGSNPDAEIIAGDETPDYTNYYLSNCPDGITHVPGFQKIVYRNMYPNIDLVLYTEHPDAQDYLEYDFIVHPGGDPSAIQMSYDHVTSLSVDEDGSFHLASPFGNVDETKPNGYQLEGTSEKTVPCGFLLKDNSIGFETGPYDQTHDLYIDPQRIWGTYYGWADTANETDLQALAADRSGNVDITGSTTGMANIATSGAFETSLGGGDDCYIAKFGPTGTLLWATYYGGSGDDYPRGIACDSNRGMVVTGFTTSTNVIASSGSFQSTFGPGNEDAFLASFDSNGVRRWGTYIRGVGWTRANPFISVPPNKGNSLGTGIAIDSSQNIAVVGDASDSGIATLGAQKYLNDGVSTDAFIAKFASAGTLNWATYFGGNSTKYIDRFEGNAEVSIDGSNNIYMSGTTVSDSGIATTGAYQTTPGSGYISKWSPTGALDWATYYLDDSSTLYNIAASRTGTVYVVGTTNDPGDATAGAYQTSSAGSYDAIMAKFSTAGKRIWATYYGGDSVDELYSIAVDTSENLFASGYTRSASGISTPGEYQTTLLGPYNPFMIKFDSACHRKWGTYYGRRGYGLAIDIDRQGHPFMGGYTETSTGEYASPGAHDANPVGHWNAFVAEFCDPLEMVITDKASDTVCPGSSVTLNTKPGLSSYQWLVNGNQIPGATTEPYTFPAPTIPRAYYYTVNGVGTDLCATVSDTFQIVVRSTPSITVPQINDVCVGGSIKLLASISDWNGPLTYSWTPAATLDHPDSLQPTAYPTQRTTYTLAVTDSNGCVTTKQLTVSFYGQPKVNAGGNRSVCSGEPATITATESGGVAPFTYSWSPSAGLNRTDSSTVEATVAKNTKYFVTVTDQNGCSSQDSVLSYGHLASENSSRPTALCVQGFIDPDRREHQWRQTALYDLVDSC